MSHALQMLDTSGVKFAKDGIISDASSWRTCSIMALVILVSAACLVSLVLESTTIIMPCHFQTNWLKTYTWLREVKGSDTVAICSLCQKTIDLANMGEGAVKSHQRGIKHIKLVALFLKVQQSSTPIPMYFSHSASGKTSVSVASTSGISTAASVAGLSSAPSTTESPAINASDSNIKSHSPASSSVYRVTATKTETLAAEVLHTLNILHNNQSFRSSEGSAHVYKKMFPDSDIASQFSCEEDKCAYLCTFGLGPYLSSCVLSKAKSSRFCIRRPKLPKYWNIVVF